MGVCWRHRIEATHHLLIDTHYHLEAAENPARIADLIESNHVLTVAVTSLPSAYESIRTLFSRYRYIRPALGLHPLLAAQNAGEVQRFRALMQTTSFIGEIGLDFSRHGRSTRDEQLTVFAAILRSIQGARRFVSVHSRGAEGPVLDLVEHEQVGPVVFHWYSGPSGTLDELLAAGHYCSINPAMIGSAKGRLIVARIPPERALSETDGPYVMGRHGIATPIDVLTVVEYLASLWSVTQETVKKHLVTNFRSLLPSSSPQDVAGFARNRRVGS